MTGAAVFRRDEKGPLDVEPVAAEEADRDIEDVFNLNVALPDKPLEPPDSSLRPLRLRAETSRIFSTYCLSR
jgi:hypothetical protein